MNKKTSSSVRIAVGIGAIAFGSVMACTAGEGVDSDESALASTCGNGVLDPGEQCDDGNTTNMDGCDSQCRFEQDQRMNSLAMQFDVDSFCTANAVGKSISSQAYDQLSQALTDSVKSGDVSVLFKFGGLTDPTGTNATNITAGTVIGKPVSGSGYDGTSDQDWWYAADPSSLDANRDPKGSLTASIANHKLTAGPGNLAMMLEIAGPPSLFNLSNVRVHGTTGAASKPTSSSSSTPGHLASEHVDAALKTFASVTDGQMCANLSAESLAKIPVPDQLTSGSYACGQGYTSANSLLDLFVGGCRVFIVNVIAATQPDQVVGAAPPGGKYQLTTSGTKVNGCKDGAGHTVPMQTCLTGAAYSAAFKFTTDRVIIK